MTFSSSTALFAAMLVLAIIPSPSVFAVVARSMAAGFSHGLVTTIGIVIGDILFIILAIYGLWAIAESMHSLFFLVKYFAAAFLIWLGISLWRSNPEADELDGVKDFSWLSNFLSGLFITLSDPKAILFYMSFLPAFIDLPSSSVLDTSIIIVIATVAVGGAKLGYAYMADKARLLFKSSRAKKTMNITAANVMIATGIYLLIETMQ